MSTTELQNVPAEAVAGSPPAAVPPADPAAPPAAGRVDGSPPSSPESPNIRQLREQYELTKQQLEPWTRLNAKPEEVAAHYPVIAKMRTEAAELGRALGYDSAEVAELFGRDPVQVLGYLRQQAAREQSQPPTAQDLRRQLNQMVEDRLKPITAREDQRLNQEAETRFNGEFDRLFKEHFKEQGFPDEAREAIADMVGQLVGEDDGAIRRLKFDGHVSDIGKYFEVAKQRFLKVVTAYSAFERKRTGGEPPPIPGQPVKPKSKLDQTVAGGITVRELMNL